MLDLLDSPQDAADIPWHRGDDERVHYASVLDGQEQIGFAAAQA
jgi:hypothetical protein